MERWKYKHPTPFDFFNTFNDVSQQNLNWFWQSWYFQHGGVPDLAITSVDNSDNKIDIVIANNGDLPMPVVLSFYNNEELVGTITKPVSVWKNNTTEINVTFNTTKKITTIKLGNDIIPDSDPEDNKYVFE